MGDEPDPAAATHAAPTEMAGASDSDTESVHAWALDDGDDFPAQRLTPGRITAVAVAASLAVVVTAGVVALIYLRDRAAEPTPAEAQSPTAQQPLEATPPPPTQVPSGPPPPPELQGVDGKFIAAMRGFGVPASDEDPQWTIDLAHAVCATVQEGGQIRYPPGTSTVVNLTKGVMENNPDWTRQQATRFTNGAVDHFCPDVWGPSQQEIAAMPPDDRYLATLQDRLGITPVDDTLIQAAHQVCTWKAQGWWTEKIVDEMASPNSREDERVIVEIATDVYCPQYSGR